jgi:hypothetical protein
MVNHKETKPEENGFIPALLTLPAGPGPDRACLPCLPAGRR